MCFDKKVCQPAQELAEMLKQWELDIERIERNGYRFQWQRDMAIERAKQNGEPIPTFDHLPPVLA